ncbi:MAG: hypothetical protein KatS3mg014_2661 [Actinomycetota bacterium]|nr:MAG: hypothetical protein KatS3mg014_2661 [Actinomycetota bacterium]
MILDVRDLIVITDAFRHLPAARRSGQVRTIVEEIEKSLRRLGHRPVRREGEHEARWVLLDYVDVVVHVFAPEDREYYDLERLWRDAPRLAWEEPSAVASAE